MIADGDAMSVAAEIAEHCVRAAEGGLGIDYPVLAKSVRTKAAKLLGCFQCGDRAVEA